MAPRKTNTTKTKRVAKAPFDSISGPAILRLTRRSGVKRLQSKCHPEIRAEMRNFLVRIIGHAMSFSRYEERTSVSAMDVIKALRSRNEPIANYASVS